MSTKPVRRAIAAGLLVAVSATALAACSTNAAKDSSDPIRFGVTAPLTGNQAQYGADWKDAIDLYTEQLNAAGGVDGRQVEVDFQDSQGDPSQAATIAQKFSDDESVLGVLGDFASPTSKAASPIYQRAGLTQIGITNSAADFTDTGDYIFSPATTQADDGPALEQATAKQGEKIGIIYVDSDWGKGGAELWNEEAQKNGDDVVFSEAVSQDTTDYKTLLTKLRDSGAQAVTIYAYYQNAAPIVKQAKQVAGLENTQWVSIISNYSDDFLENAGDAANGTIIETTYFAGSDDEQVRAFDDAFQAKYGRTTNWFSAVAYDGIQDLVWAYQNSDGTREGIRNALRDGTDIPSIVLGSITYNDDRRVSQPRYLWVRVENGKFTLPDDLNQEQ
ncbi:ABC transporter substrate-binding protein [Pseudoclavibacter soli]|uniref:ABC transporter substrate-binding protein n=1 Tax=Pseudoclavibacter soli TaxID=452623 RepID=UPI000418E9C1|nr:ABC transporter substrate-binding protein [Pseudoclavibacter soli]